MEAKLLRMPNELKEILDKQATQLGVSLNALILQILWNWVKKGSVTTVVK